MKKATKLEAALATNRAEELGRDVWENFVVPLYYPNLDISMARKPRIVMGGRGCGKTMLLRYLSHHSQFSRTRKRFAIDELKSVGLYWRADTQFLKALSGRRIDEDIWSSAFLHMIALNVVQELLNALDSILKSSSGFLTRADVELLNFDSLSTYDASFKGSYDSFVKAIEQKQQELEAWVSNPTKLQEPLFVSTAYFPRKVIAIIRNSIPVLENTCFQFYIDEYENLQDYQQREINTLLKHSEPPLIYSLAMKRNGMRTQETSGSESITDIADYRLIDLDHYLEDASFDLFAAEVLISRLKNELPAVMSAQLFDLKDTGVVSLRREPVYAGSILSTVRNILPGMTNRELAVSVLDDASAFRKLRNLIAKSLTTRGSSLASEVFIDPAHPEVAVVAPALLLRERVSPDQVLEEFDKLKRGEDNNFTGSTDWLHNNFEGCFLLLYMSFNRTCPVYAGFDSFIRLAQGNLRHFLELCYKAFVRASNSASIRGGEVSITPEDQAEAAKLASVKFMNEVRGFGTLGNRLHSFVFTLGSLFSLSQRRPSQSEPEVNHFSISGGGDPLNAEELEFFREAEKWSVLIAVEETKTKDSLYATGAEWVLNPIYAPFFHISYRKKRKLTLQVSEIKVLINGNYESRVDLLKKYADRWLNGSEEGVLQLNFLEELRH